MLCALSVCVCACVCVNVGSVVGAAEQWQGRHHVFISVTTLHPTSAVQLPERLRGCVYVCLCARMGQEVDEHIQSPPTHHLHLDC